jgi:hypothetical protein
MAQKIRNNEGGEKMGRNPKTDWNSMDWGLRDVDIAKQQGCSRERVRQVRLTLNKPKSPLWHQRFGTSKESISKLDTSNMTPEQVARETGCSVTYATQKLNELGKTFNKPPDRRRIQKYDWGSISLEQWLTLKDTEVAKLLGVGNPAVVTQWRNRHGVRKRIKARSGRVRA